MVNIHDIIADMIVLGGASAIGMVLKVALKPTEAEAKLLARILVGLGMIIMSLAKRWAINHKGDVSATIKDMGSLKDKISRHKVSKGPQG
jgi:hypothetical protein